MHTLRPLLVALALFSAPLAAQPISQAPLFSGSWEVVNYIPSPLADTTNGPLAPSIPTQAEVEQGYVGRGVWLAADSAAVVRLRCDAPAYQTHTVEVAGFLNTYDVDPELLGLVAPELEVMAVACVVPPVSDAGSEPINAFRFYFFRLLDGTLAFYGDGYFFLLDEEMIAEVAELLPPPGPNVPDPDDEPPPDTGN